MTPPLCSRCHRPFRDQLALSVVDGFAHVTCQTAQERDDRERRARELREWFKGRRKGRKTAVVKGKKR